MAPFLGYDTNCRCYVPECAILTIPIQRVEVLFPVEKRPNQNRYSLSVVRLVALLRVRNAN